MNANTTNDITSEFVSLELNHMNSSTNVYNGSEWRIWDLHVHTPDSIYQKYGKNDPNTWEKYISDLESLRSEIAVIGINDYFFIDGYERLKKEKEQNGRLQDLKLLPVVEFRLREFAGVEFGKYQRPNLHVIFSDEIEVGIIKSQFLNALQSKYLLEEGEEFNRTVDRNSLVELGKKIKNTIPPEKQKEFGSDISVGFGNLNLYKDDIYEALKKDCFTGKYLTALGKAEWSSMKWTPSSIAVKKSIINEVDFIFTAAESVESYTKSKDSLKKQGVNHLLLDCSDAHYYSHSNEKDRIGNCNTWIKGDLSIEGLKQVVFEPDYRLNISTQKPIEPNRKLQSFSFNFPEDTILQRRGSSENQPFCLNILKDLFKFSHYFTCIIGGRGTGKSTIINLIGEKLGESTKFFQDNELIINGEKYDIKTDPKSLIKISGTSEVEFVSQGKVESLAEGDELTRLVFNERIKASSTEFVSLDEELESICQEIDSTIDLILLYRKEKIRLNEKKKEKRNVELILNSINDKRYKEITSDIKDCQSQINLREKSKTSYLDLLAHLLSIINNHPKKKESNEIDKRTNRILDSILSNEEFEYVQEKKEYELNTKKFENIDSELSKLKEKKHGLNKRIELFLLEKGMNEDSIKDSQSASETYSKLKDEVENLDKKISFMSEKFESNNSKFQELPEIKSSYEELIKSSLEAINKKLQIQNENVHEIKFDFSFDNKGFREKIFEELLRKFQSSYISGTSKEKIKETLFLIPPNNIVEDDYNTDKFMKELEGILGLTGARRNNNYVKVIENIFQEKTHFYIYKLIIKKHWYNWSKNIQIKGYYGNKELQSSSFGQKCTAVIVTLMMTGLKPLIIDEPEAHLDNRLVADYLVNLLKSKKVDRQVIFATHNSNFVINGDAELIHMLHIPPGEVFTSIRSTSIENLKFREELLKLEGGEKAFKVREQKYGLSSRKR